MNNNKSMSLKKSIDQNNSIWLNIFDKSFKKSCCQSFESSRDEFNLNKISEILSLIDISSFIIQCIKQENDILKNTTEFEYSSSMNYHKIKEIDLIKLLIVIRENIDFNVKTVIMSDSCFFKEVFIRLEQLDELIKNSFFLQVNDFIVNENFVLASQTINNILDDCNADFLELETVISKISQEWVSKQQRTHQSNGRNGRLSQKIIDSLHSDVIKNLQLFEIILERLFNGYSNLITNITSFKFAQDFLLEFHSEIDEKQYQNIVNLKHFHYELEQRTLLQILELKEIQQKFNVFNKDKELVTFHHTLPALTMTPIAQKKLSTFTSTPYFSHNFDHISTYFNDSVSEGSDEQSFLSLDSGILPLSDTDISLTDSRDTLDVLPFTDEDSEKVEENKFIKGRSQSFDDSDCFGSMSTNSENDFHFCSSSKPISVKKYKKENSFINVNGFENFGTIINSFHLPKKEKEVIINKVNNLIHNEDRNIKFDWALKVTIYIIKDNPFNDLLKTLSNLERTFFSFMHASINEMPLKHNWNEKLYAQDNNSACSPNFLSKYLPDLGSQNDQNTNNNANSKDDDSADHNEDSDDLLNGPHNYINNDYPLIPSNESSGSNSHKDKLIVDQVIECSNWHLYDNMMTDKAILVNHNSDEGSLILEDIDLALRLSELHLKCEFEMEQCNDNAILKRKCEIIKRFENVKELVFKKIKEFDKYEVKEQNSKTESSNVIKEEKCEDCEHFELKENEKEQLCDTIADIDDELKTEFCSEGLENYSRSDNTSNRDETKAPLSSENFPHDNESLSLSQRISLTISLTEGLLNTTHDRINHISHVLQNNADSVGPKIVSKNIHSIYLLRKRLCAIFKILSNLKYSIKFSDYAEQNIDFITAISNLISDSNSLTKFSYNLEDWIKKANLQVDDDITDTGYLQELPNDLLVKLDNIDTESIISVSVQRLHITISSLAYYPCFYTLMKSSFKQFISDDKLLQSKKLNRRTLLSNSELILEIHKLRRIAAICALNIVDLHVIIAKIDEDHCGDPGTTSELKELLLLWAMVDKECHRLLRCNSLIQHVLMDTRRTYVEIISIGAIILSIIRTSELYDTELASLTEHLDKIHTYKLKINEWLEEVQMCSTVIHKKRITNTRFKCYEDIHNYLEENLSSISELSDNIKLGCQKSVKSLTTILSYCSDLSSTSVIDIDSAINSNSVMDNRYLSSNMDKYLFKSGVSNAIIELELTENKISHFQDLLNQSKELFLLIVGDSISSVEVHDTDEVNTGIILSGEDEQDVETSSILDNDKQCVTERVSAIATCAAVKATLLFMENNNRGDKTDNTDQQISNWTNIDQSDRLMEDAVEYIVDDITAMMTALLFQNMMTTEEEHMMIYCKLIFNDISCQLGDKALHVLIENVTLNRHRVDDKSNDLTEYFTEELSHVILNDCMFSLSESPYKKPSSIVSCLSKLQQKISQRLIEKSILYIAKFASSYINTPSTNLDTCEEHSVQHLAEYSDNLSSPSSTYRLSKKIHQEFYSQTDIMIRFTKMLSTNIMSLRNYKGDIRGCLNVPKITSEKVSKLVAHFDRSVLEKVTLRDQIIERICFNSVLVNTNSVIKELINNIVEDIPFCKSGNDFLKSFGSDSINSFSDISEKFPNSCINQNVLYSAETYNPEKVNISDSWGVSPINVERKCLEIIHNNERSQHSFSKDNIPSLSERIFNEYSVCEMTDDENISLELVIKSSSPQNTAEISFADCLPTNTPNYSPFILTYNQQQSTESIDCISETTAIMFSINSGNDSTNELQIKSVTPNSAENIIQNHLNDDFQKCINYDIYKCTFDTYTESNCIAQTSLTPFICDKFNSQNNNLHCHLDSSISTLNKKTTEHYYEESLSKLWLFICGLILLILFIIMFYDHISDACQCLRSSSLFLPKVVSSGFPF